MNDLAVATHTMPGEAREGPDSGPGDAWIFPTSFAQQRLWFLEQLQPGSSLYNVPTPFRIRGRLDRALLERSFREVIARHEILRTTFRAIDGEPMQIVSATADFHIPALDLTAHPAAERETVMRRLVREESERPFDLAAGPLLRAVLLDLGPAEQVLTITAHHLITDSWSQDVLMRELTAVYTALANGVTPALEELPIQYADFAAWQRDAMRGEVLEKELRFWRGRLRGWSRWTCRTPGASRKGECRRAKTSPFSWGKS